MDEAWLSLGRTSPGHLHALCSPQATQAEYVILHFIIGLLVTDNHIVASGIRAFKESGFQKSGSQKSGSQSNQPSKKPGGC
jgi:hypothetical protein